MSQLLADSKPIGTIDAQASVQRRQDISCDAAHEFMVNRERDIVRKPLVGNWSVMTQTRNTAEDKEDDLPWKYARTSAMITSAGSMRSGGRSLARSSGLTPWIPTSESPAKIFAIPVGEDSS